MKWWHYHDTVNRKRNCILLEDHCRCTKITWMRYAKVFSSTEVSLLEVSRTRQSFVLGATQRYHAKELLRRWRHKYRDNWDGSNLYGCTNLTSRWYIHRCMYTYMCIFIYQYLLQIAEPSTKNIRHTARVKTHIDMKNLYYFTNCVRISKLL